MISRQLTSILKNRSKPFASGLVLVRSWFCSLPALSSAFCCSPPVSTSVRKRDLQSQSCRPLASANAKANVSSNVSVVVPAGSLLGKLKREDEDEGNEKNEGTKARKR